MIPIGLLKSWWRDESGQDLVEWALLIAFVTLSAGAVLTMNADAVGQIWNSADAQLENAARTPGL